MAMKLSLFFFLSFICLQSMAENSGSVVFFDAPGHSFIRSNSLVNEKEGKELSADEVVSAISVLLGSAPDSLPIESSFKLNQVLLPNLFDRPHAVFLLEVTGIEGPVVSSAHANNKVGSTFSSALGLTAVNLRLLSDVNDISIVPLEETSSFQCDSACISGELANLGGICTGNTGLVDGELNFPLASGSSLNLHLAKKSDHQFALSLVSLVSNIRRTLEDREIFTGSRMSHAELLVGHFTGIQALREEYGSGDIVQHGIQVLQAAVTKLFGSLQRSYEGKIVGVVLSNPSANLGAMIEVSAHESRWLEEVSPPNATAEVIAEVALVRRSLAFITGIILLISTFLGIYFLLNMPLTRDTLLYSNVKLD